MRYEQLKELRPGMFKRRCGVELQTFRGMAALVCAALSKTTKGRTGRPLKLSCEDQVLLTLERRRECRTFFQLANSWGLHESSVCRIVKRVEEVLNSSKAFTLPDKKGAPPRGSRFASILTDEAKNPLAGLKSSNGFRFGITRILKEDYE